MGECWDSRLSYVCVPGLDPLWDAGGTPSISRQCEPGCFPACPDSGGTQEMGSHTGSYDTGSRFARPHARQNSRRADGWWQRLHSSQPALLTAGATFQRAACFSDAMEDFSADACDCHFGGRLGHGTNCRHIDAILYQGSTWNRAAVDCRSVLEAGPKSFVLAPGPTQQGWFGHLFTPYGRLDWFGQCARSALVACIGHRPDNACRIPGVDDDFYTTQSEIRQIASVLHLRELDVGYDASLAMNSSQRYAAELGNAAWSFVQRDRFGANRMHLDRLDQVRFNIPQVNDHLGEYRRTYSIPQDDSGPATCHQRTTVAMLHGSFRHRPDIQVDASLFIHGAVFEAHVFPVIEWGSAVNPPGYRQFLRPSVRLHFRLSVGVHIDSPGSTAGVVNTCDGRPSWNPALGPIVWRDAGGDAVVLPVRFSWWGYMGHFQPMGGWPRIDLFDYVGCGSGNTMFCCASLRAMRVLRVRAWPMDHFQVSPDQYLRGTAVVGYEDDQHVCGRECFE